MENTKRTVEVITNGEFCQNEIAGEICRFVKRKTPEKSNNPFSSALKQRTTCDVYVKDLLTTNGIPLTCDECKIEGDQ